MINLTILRINKKNQNHKLNKSLIKQIDIKRKHSTKNSSKKWKIRTNHRKTIHQNLLNLRKIGFFRNFRILKNRIIPKINLTITTEVKRKKRIKEEVKKIKTKIMTEIKINRNISKSRAFMCLFL